MKRILYVLAILSLLISMPRSSGYAQERTPLFSGQLAVVLEDGNVWVLIGDTNERIQITTDAGENRLYLSPRWSPDGQRLAYCQIEAPGAPGDMYVTRAGEWLPILLVQNVFCKEWPEGSFDWSPDGKRILYAHYDPSDPEPGGLWEVDFTSGAVSEVVAPPGRNPLRRPSYSANGEWVRMYEVLYLEGLGVLRTWNKASGNLYNWLETGADLFPGYASWSPDGSQIVFDEVTYLGFPTAGLYVAGPDGSNVQRIFAAPQDAAVRPMWSPRGDWIAFQVSTPGVNVSQGVRLVLVSPDGATQREVHIGDASLTPLGWSPDGKTLLFGQYENEAISLLGYDPDEGQIFWITSMSSWDVDWSQEPLILDLAEDLEPRAVSGFPYSEQTLLYLSPDYRLELEDLESGESADLTEAMSVAGFWVSPSRQRMLTSNRLIALDFSAEGDLLIRQVGLPSPAAGWEANWAVDESRVAYQDRQGDAWIVSVDGAVLQVPEAGNLPEWSWDGRWISYCTKEGVLTVVGPEVPPRPVAEGTLCQARWSPGSNALAYTLRGDDEPKTNEVVVYDPVAESEKRIDGGGSFAGWSPDGRLMAVRRPGDIPNTSVIFAVDPVEERQRVIGRFDQDGPYLQEWMSHQGGYQYGPYRVAADLSGVSRIVDEIYAVSPNGVMLAGISAGDIVTLACGGDGETLKPLFTIDQTGLPDEQAPGVWAELAPTGTWAAIFAYDRGFSRARLARCDGEALFDLPPESQPELGAFSADGSQYIQSLPPGSDQSGTLLYDLSAAVPGGELEPTRTITTAGGAPAFWLGTIELPEGNLPRVSGTVRDPKGEPVSGATIYLDGEPAAVSAADGAYLVPEVEPGRHTLTVEAANWDFGRASETVKVPPDQRGVDFKASQAKALPQITQEPETSPEDGSAPEAKSIEEQSAPGWYERVDAWMTAYGLGDYWIYLLAGLLGLMGAVIAGLVLRRRRRKGEPEAEEELIEADILPAPETAVEEPAAIITAPIVATEESAEEIAAEEIEPVEGETVEADEIPSPEVEVIEPAAVAVAEPKAAVEEPETAVVEPKAAVLYPTDEQVEAWLEAGIQAAKQGKYAEGWKQLRKVALERPENPRAWLWMGWTAARRGDVRTARRCLEKASELGHPRAEEAMAWLEKKEE